MSPPDSRRVEILNAAFGIFLQYGYRKTSMEDIAQAVGVSRQAVYLHFGRKEELFRALCEHLIEESLGLARSALDGPGAAVDRIGEAYFQFAGRFIDMALKKSPHAPELVGISRVEANDLVLESRQLFSSWVTETLTDANSSGELCLSGAGVSAEDGATLLESLSEGLKETADSSDDYRRQMGRALQLLRSAGRGEPSQEPR